MRHVKQKWFGENRIFYSLLPPSSLPPPPPPLSFTLSRSLSLDHNLSFRRETDRQRDRQACRQTDIQTDRQVGRQVDRPTDRQTDRPGLTLLCPLPPPNPLLPPSRISNIGTPSPSPTTLLFQKVVGQVAGTRIKIDPPPRVSFSACCFSNMSTMKVANIKGLLSVANLLLLLARALLLLLLHTCTLLPPSLPLTF